MSRGLGDILTVFGFSNLCLALHLFVFGIFGRFDGNGLDVFHCCQNVLLIHSGERLAFLRAKLAEYHCLEVYAFCSSRSIFVLVIFSVYGLHLVKICVVG